MELCSFEKEIFASQYFNKIQKIFLHKKKPRLTPVMVYSTGKLNTDDKIVEAFTMVIASVFTEKRELENGFPDSF